MGQVIDFFMHHWLLLLALVTVLVLLSMNMARARLLGFREVKPSEAVQLINHQEAVLVDTRENQEYTDGHILNAIHVPLGALAEQAAVLEPYRSRPIILYCRTGQRSARAGAILKRLGFQTVYKLDGGMMAWQSANLPVTATAPAGESAS